MDTIANINNNKYYRLFLDMDVVKLYDMLQINQSIKALRSANKTLNYNQVRFNLIIEYLLYIQNNSFIKYKEIIVQQILGTGTGYKHSKPLADLVLLIWEHKNNEIFKSFTFYNHLYFIRIRKRYVDDIKLCIDIIKDKFNNDISEMLKFGDEICNYYNWLYPSNIKITYKASKKAVYMDTDSYIDDLNIIHSKLYEKPLNKHIYLHWYSNNPLNHKLNIFPSFNFRSICINDNEFDHLDVMRKLCDRIRLRSVSETIIRKAMKNKNMVKFRHKDALLRKLDSNRKIKYINKLLQAHDRLLDDDKFISKIDIKNMINEYSNDPSEEESINIWVKKIYQQLFDDDKEFNNVLRDVWNALPDKMQEKINYKISNATDRKIRVYLN